MQHDPTDEKGEEQESFQVALHRMKMEIYHYTSPFLVFQKVVRDFEDGIGKIGMKMHRYPPNIRDLGDWCTVPRIVAIGPYHHGRQQLKEVEQVKHVAAYHCILESDHSLREVYDAVVSAAHDARHLYSKDVMAGIDDGDFLPMMFFDACFLVQYMLWHTKRGKEEMDPSLRRWFSLNRKVLRNDIMLLENQLPWGVVKAVMRFRRASLTGFVSSLRGILQNRMVFKAESFVLDDRYKPPHLLGILRHHIVGSRDTEKPDVGNIDGLSLSVSAIELAEIGIKLRANETTEVINMGLNKKLFFAELSLSPLSLNQARAIRLVNMAALELCMKHSKQEDSAVCSYLHLLSMLVHREEDVQELRARGILQGAGLTNKEALNFFTSFQSVHGSYSAIVMIQIESYKIDRRIRTNVYAFLYKNKKVIFMVLSTIVAVVSIFGTLIGILLKLN
ncbi:UPF0481 protein At3g47200 [Setaria italica]|uniref:Uncharacterized protein n=1 Tax=Setaria italica TaxID=4555 RepID=K3ZL74_SETIT|nr:UPF0481 protein At3g47200 [Setaria italica]